MHYSVLMNVLQAERYLDKPLEDLILVEKLVELPLSLDPPLEVTLLSVLHYDVDVSVLIQVALAVSDHVLVAECLHGLNLPHDALLLLL